MLRPKLLGFLLYITAMRATEIRHAALDRLIEATRKAWDVPGVAVAIVSGEDVVYIKGFGVKRAGSSAPVTPDTRFAICSTTKAFTTAAMGILVDEGKMNWDDPVRKHLPYFKLSDALADANVTMRDLVSHRSGMSSHDWLWINSPWSREEIIRRIGFVPLYRPFRAEYEYSNTMFLAAGEAVGLAANKTWEEFVATRLLAPLGMTNTDFSVKDVVKSADHATPHVRRAGSNEAVEWYNLDKVAAAGGINSSVRDLTRWMRLHLNRGRFEGKVILKESTIQEIHTPQMLVRSTPNSVNEGPRYASYGLGWNIQDYRGHHLVHHAGAIDGFRSVVALLPNEHYGIAILGNVTDLSAGLMPDLPEVLRSAIIDELLGLPAKDRSSVVLIENRKRRERATEQSESREAKRRKDSAPSLAIKNYVGSYEDPAYGRAQVRDNAGKLELHWNNWQMSLEHYQFDTFRTRGAGQLNDSFVQFHLYPSGAIESFRLLGRDFYRRN